MRGNGADLMLHQQSQRSERPPHAPNAGMWYSEEQEHANTELEHR